MRLCGDGSMQETIKQIEALIKEGLISDEDAREVLEDIQRTLEIEDEASDIALKGQMLTAVSALLKLV
jgi:polyhydroxyalkanoate synthesis regulator phasin